MSRMLSNENVASDKAKRRFCSRAKPIVNRIIQQLKLATSEIEPLSIQDYIN